MPRGDGTGPMGQGPIGGGRAGMGAQTSGGKGRMGGSVAAGPNGFCICPQCGAKVSHQIGLPCTSVSCPQCGTKMVRG